MILLLAALAQAADSELLVGSYGRADVAMQPDGGAGEPVILTAHPGRLYADPYLELDLGWRMKAEDGATFSALVTPALSGALFHYDGTFDASLAVRNLYAKADDVFVPGLGFWAGSRMYRGDDVYLLDFWPLDNLNTVGGGVYWQDPDTFVGLHAGMNRLSGEDWQSQSVDEVTPGGVAADPVLVLDRQRLVTSLKASRVIHAGKLSIRPKLAGELHAIPEGTRYLEDRIDVSAEEALPAEHGYAVGGQLSAWGWGEDSFVHLFYRHATGIAAVGELTIPTTGYALDGSVNAWREDTVALSANQQGAHYSITAGAYLRAWHDADGNEVDVEDGVEYTAILRPGVYIGQHGAVMAEVSHQYLHPNGLNPLTDSFDVPQATNLSLLPAVQWRPGAFGRPQVHLRYTMTMLNEGAQAWYSPTDTRAQSAVQHSFGVGAEWWINSQGYR